MLRDVGSDETHALGYEQVDDDPHVGVLIATMDDTADWQATQQLRDWERSQLSLRPGQRLLDVGCGLGDAALSLAEDLGTGGEIVGVDASAAMIAGAHNVRARHGRTNDRPLRPPAPAASVPYRRLCAARRGLAPAVPRNHS